MKSFLVLRAFLVVALKGVKVLSAVIKSDHTLNTLVSIHHAVGLAGGHAFRPGIHESFKFRFALDFRLPVSA